MSQITAPCPEPAQPHEKAETAEISLEDLMKVVERSIRAAEEAELEAQKAKGIELVFPFLRTGGR